MSIISSHYYYFVNNDVSFECRYLLTHPFIASFSVHI